MKRSLFVCLFLFLLVSFPVKGQTRFRVVSYNVENLFDCRHDSLKNDLQFLPTSTRKWSLARYWSKLNRISKVLTAIGEDRAPELVALCEVENDSVLTDLTCRSRLRAAAYRYVMTSSDDPRGMDVALLYKPSAFKMIQTASIKVPMERYGREATRDILWVSGRILTNDTLDVVVCHWPSQVSGKKKTERYRLAAAQVVRTVVDSLAMTRSRLNVIVMGDFNETLKGSGLQYLLSVPATNKGAQLVTLPLQEEKGTYRYRGHWEQLDHLLFSVALCDTASSLVASKMVHVANYPFLLEVEPLYGGYRPIRTYRGMRYHKGYSDHLPIWTDLLMNDDRVGYSK